MTILRKVEARLEKTRDEVETFRWHARLNPARRLRFKSYDKMLTEARRLWHDGDSASSFAALQAIDLRYPSVIGMVYGTPRKRENRKKVYESRKENPPKPSGPDVPVPPGGFLGGFGGGGGA